MGRIFIVLVGIFVLGGCGTSSSDETSSNEIRPTPGEDSFVDDDSMAGRGQGAPTLAPAQNNAMEGTADSAMPQTATNAPNTFTFPGDMADRFGEAVCSYLERCDAENKLATLLEAVLNEDCVSFVQNQYAEQTLARLLSPVREGDVRFDQVAAETCISGFDLLDCTFSLDNLPEACRFAFRGNLSAGDRCTVAEACPDEHSCTMADNCPGICTAWSGQGEPCHDQLGCQDGLVCFQNSCQPYTARGAACGEDFPPCDAGPPLLACNAQPTEQGLCEVLDQANARNGAPCSPLIGPFCGDGLACVIENPNPLSGRCRELQAEGQRCRIAIPDQCQAGTYCEGIDPEAPFFSGLEGDCRALPDEGSPCGQSLLGGACSRNTICVNDICKPRARLGESCSGDSECYSGACVNAACGFPGACGQ